MKEQTNGHHPHGVDKQEIRLSLFLARATGKRK